MSIELGDRVFHNTSHKMGKVVALPKKTMHDDLYVTVEWDGEDGKTHTSIASLTIAMNGRPDLGEIHTSALRDIREARGLPDPDNYADDDKIFHASLESNIHSYLEWNGVIGYTSDIMSIIRAYYPEV